MTGLIPLLRGALLAACLATLAGGAAAQAPAKPDSKLDTTVVEAREAARKRDRNRLAAAKAAMQAGAHPLTPWVEYWDLTSRLPDVQVEDVEAFYTRWSGSYVEDRLRNDWLLELGRRRDWPALARDYPRFRMNDDREVSCWWLFTEHLAGKEVADAARPLWFAQREVDDGCNLLATALVDGKRFSQDDVYRKARLSLELQRPGAAKAALGLLGNGIAREAAEALDNPARYLRRGAAISRHAQELRVLAVMRLAQSDADTAIGFMDERGINLSPSQAAWAWAYIGRQAAFKLSSEAAPSFQRAASLLQGADGRANPGWSDDTLAWGVRATLRGTAPAQRWPLVLRLVDWMGPQEARDPAWAYWRARALHATAAGGTEGDAQRAEARRQQEALASGLNFYAALAAEDLGRAPSLPPAPAAPTPAERDAAANHPGLQRALLLVGLGLRDEARREWNFSLRGMDDRALLAAARLACERSDWHFASTPPTARGLKSTPACATPRPLRPTSPRPRPAPGSTLRWSSA